MAYVKIDLPANTWTLIGNNVSSITFQNASQFAFYVNFTASNSAPSDSVGLVYGPWTGELKKTLTDLTSVSSPAYVWARPVSGSSKVIVEQ